MEEQGHTINAAQLAVGPRRKGWVGRWDDDSLKFSVAPLVAGKTLKSKAWTLRTHLDQGQESSCVGNGHTGFRMAAPKPVTGLTEADAYALYKRAQEIDAWPGENYDGTSVLAGAKAAKEKGWISAYRWSTTLLETVLTLAWVGPVVVGTPWFAGMNEPDADGWMHVTGENEGGHCYLLKAVQLVFQPGKSAADGLAGVDKGKSYVKVHNSWGTGWGLRGDAKLSLTDLETLIVRQKAEICLPVKS